MLTRDRLLDIMGDGRITALTFTKRDGSIRHMSARLGVTKHLKGGTKPYDDAERNILTVFDMGAKGYRAVRLDSITSVAAGGQTVFRNGRRPAAP